MSNLLLETFAKSRAEEYPDDLWESFVIPPMYKDYSRLFNYTKAVMIEGGRGSGKTMFLKYHCHKTRFSSKRPSISSDELKHVGLYFRPDTDFCAMINEFNFQTNWKRTFSHYVSINIIEEFISAIDFISKTTFEDISFDLDLLDLETPESLRESIRGFPIKYRDIQPFQKSMLSGFNLWLNDPDSFEKPQFLEPRTVLLALTEQLKEQVKELANLSFYIYFDEFENLNSEQQKAINNWIKHGKNPLVFNAAYKKGANVSRDTSSNERLVQRNDYRIVNLDDVDNDEFRIFSAEVLTLKLYEALKFDPSTNIKTYFSDELEIDKRKIKNHKEIVIKIAKEFLPESSFREISVEIINDKTLIKRVEKFLISPALEGSHFTFDSFIDRDFPEESLINGLLLNRKSYTPEKVFRIFEELKSDDGKSKYRTLIEQNLAGAILWVYLSASWKKCPVYTGFDRFCLMARGNMRHFLELCHQTLSIASRNQLAFETNKITSIPTNIQAEAAYNCSRLELEKIDELGKHGEKLRFIANRLGSFFQLIQKRKSQSETEVNHFSIKVTDNDQLDEVTKTLLSEAVIWSILIEIEGSTKRKGLTDIASNEYMLHPIYSPHFGISYRRKKKFEFSADQIKTIFSGSEESYLDLCKGYLKKWDLSIDENLHSSSVLPVQKGLWE
ncbi:hypothetical protein [Marinobacter sp.]|uniref:ORC-CDC6 family AAA ATPase n=1 Tax=Marinobacter sp. TaxID=50741 RepID=UPI001B42DC62|nr:hypothetical protein [Marinobacter sp.]MBQ0832840.1 hypothetical protein [Marinobacter sp.]